MFRGHANSKIYNESIVRAKISGLAADTVYAI